MEITHPYHPLARQRYPLLKSRTVLGVECVVLKGSPSGTFSVPKDWTSLRTRDGYEDANVPPTMLRVERLLELTTLVAAITKSISEK